MMSLIVFGSSDWGQKINKVLPKDVEPELTMSSSPRLRHRATPHPKDIDQIDGGRISKGINHVHSDGGEDPLVTDSKHASSIRVGPFRPIREEQPAFLPEQVKQNTNF